MASDYLAIDDLKDLMITETTTITDMVNVLNRFHKRVVLVVDDENRLLGVVTDSDIRHAILDEVNFSRPVRDIMVRNPVQVGPDASKQDVIDIMEQTHCFQIPVVDPQRKILGIYFIDQLLRSRGQTHARTAVIMAGGLGSRLAPLTDKTPKPLLPVGDQPILFTVLDQLQQAGFDNLYVSLNYKSEMIREAVDGQPRFAGNVHFIDETEPLGTAGALTLLPEKLDEPLLVMNGDLLTNVALAEMLNFHQYQRNLLTLAVKEEEFKIPYGIVEMEGTRIVRLKEKPTKSVFINTGVYVLSPLVLDRIPKKTFWNMTDVIEDLHQTKLRVGGFPVHEYWLDVGEHSQLKQANADFEKNFSHLDTPQK